MSKRDKRKAAGNAAERASSGTQNTGGILFDADKQSAADVWGNATDTPDSDSVMNNIYGASAPSAAELESKLETAIVADGHDMVWGRWRLSPVGLHAPADVSATEYEQIGQILLSLESRLQWLIGDWIAYGDKFEWGQTYETLAAEFGYEVQTLRDYAYVCRNVDLSIRIDTLTFGHHQVVTALDSDKQAYWLERAAKGDDGSRWSIKRLREEIKAEQGKLPAPQSRFEKLVNNLAGVVGYAPKLAPDERQKLASMLREAAERIEELE